MKIAIIGATGRMGAAIINEINNDENLELASGFGEYQGKLSGVDLGEIATNKPNNILSSDDLNEVITAADAVIDFSAPTLTLKAVKIASELGKIYVCGTTGFSDDEFAEFKNYATNSPFLWSSNMSIGVNLLTMLAEKAASVLGEEFDTEIIEMHHRYKKDAPSGTAISLGKAVADAKNLDFNTHAALSREGADCMRKNNEIGFATLRGGSVIGDHSVIFAADNERIELSHKAVTRNIFANGALKAAKWCQGKKPGLYSIRDVLA